MRARDFEHDSARALAAAPRSLGRRHPTTSGRALLGALLVTLAAVAAFTGYARSSAGTVVQVVVAARHLPPDHLLTAADLEVTTVAALPAATRGSLFSDPDHLAGARLVAPLRAGELVQASAVARDGPRADERQVSFPVARAFASGGLVAPGERVDVLATYGEGTDGFTEVVVADAKVTSVTDQGPADLVVTVAVRERADALGLAHAAHAGRLMLVRNGTAPSEGWASYRPRPSAPADGR